MSLRPARVSSSKTRDRHAASRGRLLAAAATLSLAAALGALGASCGKEPATQGTGPCDTVYAGQCGASCSYDLDCPAGLYCGGGACTADCAPGVACPGDQVCTDNGHCSGGDGAGGAGGSLFTGSGGAGQGGGSACPDVDVTFKKQTPTVLLLLDQSGSMTAAFPGSTNRWQAMYDSLMDPQTGVVKALENEVRFGLALYTYSDGGPVCPVLTEVDISLGNHAAIDAVFSQAQPVEDTPTGDSIDAVVPQLLAYPEEGPKVIVLATDGEPDTCEVPDPQTPAAQDESIAAAQNAYNQGLPTYVISVGPETSQQHLQDLANAGAGLPVGGAQNATFYLALDQSALFNAFQDIINGVRSCVIDLDGSLTPEDAAEGHVILDGQELPFNDPNGWSFTPPDKVELQGTACEAIQSGDHELTVTFPCGIVTPE
jgi:hypothetical protein